MKQKKPAHSDGMAPLQPLIDLTTISFNATQKLAELQVNFVSFLLDANLKQLKILLESQDFNSAIEQQLAFFNEIDTKWYDTAAQEIATARDVQHSINEVLEKNIPTPESLEPFSKEHSQH